MVFVLGNSAKKVHNFSIFPGKCSRFIYSIVNLINFMTFSRRECMIRELFHFSYQVILEKKIMNNFLNIMRSFLPVSVGNISTATNSPR
jgi:hypothetical protein